jgi:hypothetical protein
LVIDKPDVTADDNGELATAAGGILTAITTLGTLVGDSEGLREMSLRMFAKFSGENLTDLQVKGMLTEGKADLDRKKKMEEDESKAKSVIKPASPAPGGKK